MIKLASGVVLTVVVACGGTSGAPDQDGAAPEADVACPVPGPSNGGTSVPATADGCPASYCYRCTELDLPPSCPNAYCVATAPSGVGQQCMSVCFDASTD